jgi:tetratricopeptide (TPR) repeat protein
MTKKGNLFFLIKSLTKSEKRYFKIFCFTQKVSNNYLQLFEAIDQQEEFDEAAIKQQFEGQSFTKQLHVTKNYLNKLILKSLRNYHANISKKAQLKDILRNVEILFLKELYDQCHYELLRAEKIARTYDRLADLLEVLHWKKRLILVTRGNDTEALTELTTEEASVIEELGVINDYWEITNSIMSHMGDKEERLLEQPCFRRDVSTATIPAEVLRHHILYTYYTINNKAELGLTKLKELMELLEQRPEVIKDDPGPYTTALNNQIGSLVFMRRYDEVATLLDKVKGVPERYQLHSESLFTIRLRLRVYNIELELYRDTEQWEKGKILILEIKDYLKKHHRAVSQEYFIKFWYQFANIYFMCRAYTEALKWVNELIATNFKDKRKDLQRYARLLNLMIHFELGNTFVLKYGVDSTRRFLNKHEELKTLEQIVLRFFSRICRVPETEFPELFQYLYSDLLEGDQPLATANVLDYLNFDYWIKLNLRKKW